MNKNLAKNGIFKAYDIRGRYPEEINEEVIGEIAMALRDYFQLKTKNSKLKTIVVGHDARLSSPALYKAVIKAFRVKGIAFSERPKNLNATNRYTLTPTPYTLITVGFCSTPMLYFLVNHYKAAGGIMITASHNPPEYNGMKVVKRKAEPMGGEEIRLLVENEP